MLKSILFRMLEKQVQRYIKKHKIKIVAIAGSVGKTSAKLFTKTVLSQHFRVQAQEGNHNTRASVPMAVFGLPFPEGAQLRSITTWWRVIREMKRITRQRDVEHEVIVLELGTDHPGDLKEFSRYLHPDIGVVTAVAPEHMEYFKTIDAVAQEELSLANFSHLALINRDDIDSVFARYVQAENIDTYGISGVAEYRFITEDFSLKDGFKGKFVSPEFGEQPVTIKLIGEHNIKSAVGAAAVGIKLGMPIKAVLTGLQAIRPVNGRMNVLRGQMESTIIDDTYNSSPKAAVAALQTLYLLPAKQKIAILGSMNELGDFSKKAHEEVGAMCDPTLLDWVITIGAEAEKYLAPAARAKGCQVRSFKSSIDAGAFAHSVLHPGAVVLAKGSQNGVFAEEAIKILLHETEEEDQLVRQSADWIAIKDEQFSKFKDPTK